MSIKSGIASQVLPLPSGGGALKGIGETFSPDLFTGTGNMTVPLDLPPGRNGFQPELSLEYSTGNGNGPFGLGWQLSLPGVTRKTSKGVPRYRDAAAAEQQDTFVLSSAEDLVRIGGNDGVERFRPRTEGLFARIERDRTPGSDVWRVHGGDGLVSVYGTPRAAGDDPAVLADPAAPARVFAWRLSETTDPFGNRIAYDYLHDAGDDPSRPWAQLYPQRVRYVDHNRDGEDRFLVSVSFEYEERPDQFSDCRAGFETRTRLRCRRIQVHTHAVDDLLVRTYELDYLDDPSDGDAPANGMSLLRGIRVVGHDGGKRETLPPLEFGYTRFAQDVEGIRPLTAASEPLPAGSLASDDVEVVGLFGNGLPDIVQMNGVPQFWRNQGSGVFAAPEQMPEVPAAVHLPDPGVHLADLNGDGRTDLLALDLGGYFPLGFDGRWRAEGFVAYDNLPSVALAGPNVRFMDLDGDGVVDALRTGAQEGFELLFNHPTAGWGRVETRPPLEDFPELGLADPRVKLGDLNGDGLQDLVLVQASRIDYWPYLGHGRWGPRVTMDPGPVGLPPPGQDFDAQRVLIGDVDGDGLDDLVYVEPRRVTVWINRSGNGFSDPFRVEAAPLVGELDGVRLADMLGSGTAGIVWSTDAPEPGAAAYQFLDLTAGVKPYLLETVDNHMGAVTRIRCVPSTSSYLADAEDETTRWRTPLAFPVQVVAGVEVIDEISGGKLTTEYDYHHGYWDGPEREFRGFGLVEQRDSEKFERFNDPGMHGQDVPFRRVDSQRFSPPTLTRTWFHLGDTGDEFREREEIDHAREYWPGDPQVLTRPADTDALLAALSGDARAAALRSLRGSILRTELYALDGTSRADRPYTVTERQYGLREEDRADGSDRRERIFFAHQVGERTTQWERGDDAKTEFSFRDRYDAYGFPTAVLSIAVPRGRDPLRPAPAATHPYLATYATTEYARRDTADQYIVDRVARATSYEVLNDGRPSVLELRDAVLAAAEGESDLLRLIGHSRTYYDGPAHVGLPLGELGRFGLPVRVESLAVTDDFLDDLFAGSDPDAVSPRPPYLDRDGAPTWTPEYPEEFRARLPALAGYAHYREGDVPGSPGGYYIVEASHRYDHHDASGLARGLPIASRDPLGAVLAGGERTSAETRLEYDRFGLLVTKRIDAAGLVTQAAHDYRVLQPREITNANGNTTAVAFSPLGFVAAQHVRGKNGEGDAAVPSIRHEYDLLAFSERRQPISVRTVRRVYHDTQTDVPVGERDEVIASVEYSDGFGRLLQTRAQAEDTLFGDPMFGGGVIPADQSQPVTATVGRARQPGDPENVIVSGWQTYDNKGGVVERYEPFFAKGFEFAEPVDAELGKKATVFYDPRGQAIRTVNPDGSEQRVVFGVPVDLADPDVFVPTPWESYTYDANDNAGRTHGSAAESYHGHWNTPASSEFDALSRTIRTVARNGPDPAADWYVTRSTYDILGNPVAITDALGRDAFSYRFDLGKRCWRMDSIDAGRRDTVPDALGNPVESRDSKGALTLSAFDLLHRPTRVWARDAGDGPVTLRRRVEYGDAGDADQPAGERDAARAHNLLGIPVADHDEAGLATVMEVDFNGNVLDSSRRMIADAPILAVYERAATDGWQIKPFQVDWQPASGQTLVEREAELLEATAYQTTTSFDALNRVVRQVLPLDVDGRRRELRPRYNRAGGLEQVRLDDTVYVERICYDAKGQRALIAFGNGVMTRYAYDPHTFHLTRLRSEHYTEDGATYRPSGEVLQDCSYDYDLAGNVVGIRDRTPGSGIANNPEAFAASDPIVGGLLARGDALDRRFTYDPLYRLLTATGRECGAPADEPWLDAPRCTDLTRTRAYIETYAYNAAGSMLRLAHRNDPGGFVREFSVEKGSNRLRRMIVGATPYDYVFDSNGNMRSETTSRHFEWNHADQLKTFATQTDGAEPSVHAHYLYGGTGQRMKKLVRRQGGGVEVTSYVSAVFEHHRWGGSSPSAGENNHVHVLDDRRRIALVRLGAAHPDERGSAVQFHLADHLDSSTVITDEAGGMTNREEFTPYGETSFGSFARKRYRFTGKERDEESGLSYHVARYYSPVLGRWTACDPLGHKGGLNLYQYCAADPCNKVDLTGGEWCWIWEDDCGVDWETVGQAVATAEVVFGCGLVPFTEGATAFICLDGVDNWTAATMKQPTAKEAVISTGLQATGVSEQRADQVAALGAMAVSGAIAAHSWWLQGRKALAPIGDAAATSRELAASGKKGSPRTSGETNSPTTSALKPTTTGSEAAPGGGAARAPTEAPTQPASRGVAPAEVRAAPPERVAETGFGEWKATWRNDPKALVMVEPQSGGVVRLIDVYRGGQPRGTAGQMVADTLRAAGIPRPTSFYLSNVVNKETLEALARGVNPADTLLGKTVQRAAAELGGTITGWSSGVEIGKTWIRATVSYP